MRRSASRSSILKERAKWLAKVKPEDRWQLEYQWEFWARDDQRPPQGDWRTWFVMAGRGFGKTRMAAEWVRAQAEADGSLRIALVAATMHEARSVMIEGESGLLAIAPDEKRPTWEPSLETAGLADRGHRQCLCRVGTRGAARPRTSSRLGR